MTILSSPLVLKNFMQIIPEEEILLAEILNKRKEFLIMHPFIKLGAAQERKFEKMRKELKKGVPLAYVLGYKWFYNTKFKVNENVLIPRPETEQLVERALERAKKQKFKKIIDIGTGPGTIVISIKKFLKTKAQFIAGDISSKALAVARINQKELIVDSPIKFVKSDLLKSFKDIQGGDNILITSNLPYLSKKELKEPSIQKEPRLALYGGKVSHSIIQKLIIQINALNLSKSVILLEINYDQGKVLQGIIKKYLPGADIKIHKDFSGYDRIIEIYLP
ncbi:MAG: peptide chain release factor N(5)-glutamine methyltransferase [Candidatus Doudnabacteria bacterium]